MLYDIYPPFENDTMEIGDCLNLEPINIDNQKRWLEAYQHWTVVFHGCNAIIYYPIVSKTNVTEHVRLKEVIEIKNSHDLIIMEINIKMSCNPLPKDIKTKLTLIKNPLS